MTSTITTTALVKQYPNGVRGVDGVDIEIAEGEHSRCNDKLIIFHV